MHWTPSELQMFLANTPASKSRSISRRKRSRLSRLERFCTALRVSSALRRRSWRRHDVQNFFGTCALSSDSAPMTWNAIECNWCKLMIINVSFVNWCNGESDRPLAFLVVAKGARRNLRQGGQAVYAKAACLLGGPIQHRYSTRIGRASWGHFKLALWQLPKLS